MRPKGLIEIKAKMLCEGVNVSPEIEVLFEKQNPFKVKRGGLSSGGKMKLAGLIDVNAPIYRKKTTDLKLVPNISNPDGFIVNYNDEPLCTGEILKSPDWYKEKVNEFSITQILTQHGDHLAGAIYEDCALFGLKEECKFCVINHSLVNKSPLLVRKKSDLFIKALSKIPRGSYKGLSLNGGMTTHSGRGMEIIEPIVRKITTNFSGIDIAVEITPPLDLTWIDKLREAGVKSLMMNMECWDDKLREKIIPGKNRLCTKEMYFKAFKHAVKVFGLGKVSSCFVVGIESMASIKEGIKSVIDLGVIPSPLSGRYFEDITDYPFMPNVNFKDLLEIFDFTSNLLEKSELESTDKSGCVACGMCDLIGNTKYKNQSR